MPLRNNSKYGKNVKVKNKLKQFEIAISIIILAFIIGYISLQNKSEISETLSNQTIQTNIENICKYM